MYFDWIVEIFLGFRQVKYKAHNTPFFYRFLASGQARCPIAISSFPPAIGRGVRLTACKDIQNLPNCQTIREIFCDYSWVLLSPMFIFPFLPSIFILSRYACSTGERVFTWYLRYSRDCNDKKTPSVTCHMEIFDFFFPTPHPSSFNFLIP